MRSRNIKPGFFTNEALLECPPLARILFEGLWCMADRDGRLEDRPKKIKVAVLPADDCDIDQLLQTLHNNGLICRYEIDGQRYIDIPKFKSHQRPHFKEPTSVIPPPQDSHFDAPGKEGHSKGGVPGKEGHSKGGLPSLIPDSGYLIPDSGMPSSADRPPLEKPPPQPTVVTQSGRPAPRSTLQTDNPDLAPQAKKLSQHYFRTVRPSQATAGGWEKIIAVLQGGHSYEELHRAITQFGLHCEKKEIPLDKRAGPTKWFGDGGFAAFLDGALAPQPEKKPALYKDLHPPCTQTPEEQQAVGEYFKKLLKESRAKAIGHG